MNVKQINKIMVLCLEGFFDKSFSPHNYPWIEGAVSRQIAK